MGKIPKAAAQADANKKKVTAPYGGSFNGFLPAWRIGKFDYPSKWGLKSLLGQFVFQCSSALDRDLIEKEDDKLYEALQYFNGKEFDSIEDFWHRLSSKYGGDIPSDMLEHISLCLVRDGFQRKIYPKLQEFEKIKWEEILSQTHRRKDQMVSNNHSVPVSNLSKEARDRLEELKYNVDFIFSLRLEALLRIYGFRVQNYLEILWVDRKHEVYDLDRD